MTIFTKALQWAALVTMLSLLSACGSGSSDIESGQVLLTCDVPQVPNEAGTECVDPEPIKCKAPTVPDAKNESCIVGENPNLPEPSYFPKENEAVLYYKRPGNTGYEGYRIHTWNNESCDAYAPPHDQTDWANGHQYAGIDPNYGAYWVLNLKDDHNECGNFIVHIGTDGAGKAQGDVDSKMPLLQDHEKFARMNFIFDGVADVYEFPLVSLGASISGASGHWISQNTLLWNIDPSSASSIKLHHLLEAGIEIDDNNALNGNTIELTQTTLTDEEKVRVPHLSDWAAFSPNLTADEAKALVKEQLVLASYDIEGKLSGATYVQAAKVLDDLYTRGENDADEQPLGVFYDNGVIINALWAPTARNVSLKIYNADKSEKATVAMTFDPATGIWRAETDISNDRLYYRYALSVYHPETKQVEELEATDPYSLNVSTNGRYSQFVNLDDSDLKPDGWDGHLVATVANPEAAVIYEGHVRDFSARDESTPMAHRGKYMAFTHPDSVPMQHLKALADNGLTHFHLLPLTDMATIDERANLRIDLDDTLATLCQRINDDAKACKVDDTSLTIKEVLASYLPSSEDAKELVAAMKQYDSFNWGYDPHHFIAPEGSYATDAEGTARIVETRAMVKALHDIGLRVVLDVVYNHTNASGVWENSVFDKVVPGYYHRYSETSGNIERSTCCENTATEHRMMDKFVTDSMVILAKQFGYDGFRFDVMGHMPKDSILAAREAVWEVDPDNYFYGEGWDFGEVAGNRLFTQAKQVDMAGSEVGTYNDRIREAIRGGNLFKLEASDDTLKEQDTLRLSLAGNLADYVLKDFNGNSAKGSSFSWGTSPVAYALDPADSVNYISKHDNETLWDKLQLVLDESLSREERVRIQTLSHASVLMSQGIPFLQMGGELIRSKSLDRNTYDGGDWFNYVDFTKNTNNWHVGLPLERPDGYNAEQLAEIATRSHSKVMMSDIDYAQSHFNSFLRIRTQSPLFSLTTADDVIARLGFHNVGKNQTQGVIVMSIDDGEGLVDLDPNFDAVVVMINTSNQTQSHTVPTAAGFVLHPELQTSADPMQQSASFTEGEGEGTFTVAPYTVSVFVKEQGDAQGSGLAATATVGLPDVLPYGSTQVLVRGDMNGWGTDNAFSYQGDGIYRAVIALEAQSYGFKVADADWATVNFGAEDGAVVEGEAKSLTFNAGNLSFTPSVAGSYVFELDASNKDAPSLKVYNQEPFVGQTVYLRGGMNSWGDSTPMTYVGDARYQVAVTLAPGTVEFKLADANWQDINYGALDSGALVPGESVVAAYNGNNFALTVETEASYLFTFDLSDRNNPVVSVHFEEMFQGETLYLRGSLNSWGTDNPMTHQGFSVYTTELVLEAGDYEFKLASSDWNAIDYGAAGDDTSVALDTAKVLGKKGSNMTMTITESGTYRFTFKGPDAAAPSVTVSMQ